MAEKKEVTPEKQLLNLIEEPKSMGSLQTAAIKYQGSSIFSPAALKGRFRFIRNRFAVLLKLKDPRQLDIKALNEILKIIVVILTAYLFFSIGLSALHLKKGTSLKPKTEGKSVVNLPGASSLLKTGSYYLEKARARDIFSMGLKRTNLDIPRGPSQRIIEATQHLKLVGISWSQDPDVMIEDTKTQRTFFLKKGQTIDNEIKLQAVFKDKVILSYEGEEIELR